MTLRDTELIGKKLVKYGFYRNPKDHHKYSKGDIRIEFKSSYGQYWVVDITYEFDVYTVVNFLHVGAVFTPEWLVEEHKKLQAMFKFIRG